MPYLDPSLEEDNKKDASNGAANGASSASPVLGQSSGLSEGGGSGNATAGASSGKPSSSGAFTNLQSYLDANKDQNFGSQVAGKVQSDVDSANSSQNDAKNQFDSSVDNSTVKYNPDLVAEAQQDPTQITNNADQLSQWNKMRTAQYNGPSAFTDQADLYGNTYAKTQNAFNEGQATQTEGGQKALLDQFYSQPSYSYGQKNLDSLLVSQDPNAQQAFGNVWNNAQQSQGNFNNLTDSLNQYAQQGKDTTGQAAQGVQNFLYGADSASGAIPTFQNQLTKAATDANAAQPAAIQGMQSRIKNSNLTDADYKQLGLAPGTTTYNVDASNSNYFTPTAAATAQTVATPEQRAKINALYQLAGQNTPAISADTQQYTNPFTYDTNRFNNDVGAAQKTYQNVLNTAVFHPYAGTTAPTDLSGYSLTDNSQNLPNLLAFINHAQADSMRSMGAGQNTASTLNDAFGNTEASDLPKAQAILQLIQKQYGANKTLGNVNEDDINPPGPIGIL